MAVTEKQLANLRPKKQGESANPNGRPRVLPELKEALITALTKKSGDLSALERIIRKLVDLACHGNIKAAELLLDRAYGRAKIANEGLSNPVIVWNETKTYELSQKQTPHNKTHK